MTDHQTIRPSKIRLRIDGLTEGGQEDIHKLALHSMYRDNACAHKTQEFQL